MRILRRLYLSDFFRLLVLLSFGLSLIVGLIDLIGRVDDFLPNKPSLGSLVLYAFYSTPKFFLYLLPLAVLICGLFTFSQASRRKEITAIKAAGGRLQDLFLPFIIVGAVLSIAAFLVGEFVVPDFSTRSVRLRNALEGKGKKSSYLDGVLWVKDKNSNPVKIELYIPDRKSAQMLTIFIQGKDFLDSVVTAKRATWNQTTETWTLEGVIVRNMKTGKTEEREEMEYRHLDSPDIFAGDIRKSDEMGIVELHRYIERMQNAGFNNIKLLVDLNAKVSFPLINIFMMVLGISLSGRTRVGGGLFITGLGIGISLFYWFGYTFALSLGYAGIVPPVIAAWATPLLFGALAIYLYTTVPE